MIRQIPKQHIDKQPEPNIESYAAVCNLENYTAVVRGKWKLVRGTDASGNFTVVLVGPHAVTSNLVGIQILMAAGFSDVDAMFALGVNHIEYKGWLKQQRNRNKTAKAQPRMGNTCALDDL
ncbi:hypothetical protein HOT49_gp291 [Erwinia phage vB_EamM_Alexandra]|uniref:Uncharacterized protein n=1 Tax=Erwinia phage vB_EamM_Alexandra TaxID=2201424 RepID=A0A2Z4QE50_9CAUD|nr:hypothetical protein HOT49_gp291 [Erwinia phage vB_EamM_Alexandra]AWY08550.1 hypothetical protein Alexandra_294 [Erwinia phage vB_EamM_Alexandra]